MRDRALDHLAEQRRRGKNSGPKRSEPGRAVRDLDGRIIAVIKGRHLTDADVDQARALVAWMPDYTAAIGGQTHG